MAFIIGHGVIIRIYCKCTYQIVQRTRFLHFITPICVYQWYFGGMDLLEWIIKIQQIPPSGCLRSVDSSDLLMVGELGELGNGVQSVRKRACGGDNRGGATVADIAGSMEEIHIEHSVSRPEHSVSRPEE